MKRSVSLCTAFAALLLAGTSSRAANIPWSFNWTATGGPDLMVKNKNFYHLASNTSGTYLRLTNEPLGKSIGNATGTTELRMTAIKVFSNAPPHTLNPPSFNSSKPVTFTLTLTDKMSGATHDFLYTVQFGGHAHAGAAEVTASFSGTTTSSNVQIGSNLYSIGSPVYIKPGPPDSSKPSGLFVTVSVIPDGSSRIQGAPEPSAMALSCVGLSLLGLATCCKRRRPALQLA
jgi:hypothetical protein